MSGPETPPTPAEAEEAAPAHPAPPVDPDAFTLRQAPPRVMRLSRKAMAVIGIAAGIGIGGSLIYALQRHGPAPMPQNVYTGDAHARSEFVTEAPADYAEVPTLGRPLPGDLGRPILDAEANGKAVPVPPISSSADPRAAAIEQARQRQDHERDSARTSAVFLGGPNAAVGNTKSLGLGPSVPAAVASTPPTTAADASQSHSSAQSTEQAFLEVTANRPTTSMERLALPPSPNVLQAGSIIPAALITGIRSDLPGQITAQVTENVYDSPTGRVLLIPQGSRLIGEYDSSIAAGQDRVLLAWDRLILPGGRSILLDRQPGADAAGMAGLQDRTDYHWGGMLKAALVSTLLGVGSELATANDSDLAQALRYGTQDTVNQTGRGLVQRQINIAPTITIRPGYPLRVIVTRDLVLEPLGDAQ